MAPHRFAPTGPASSAPHAEAIHAVLQARVMELERRNDELDRFAATAAHELRAPLIAIEGYTALLSDHLDGALDDAARQDLEAVMRGTTWMRMLVDVLLQHARSRERPLGRADVRLDAIVKDCIAMLGPEIVSRRARIVAGPLPAVSGDASLLGIVLQNLVANAVRYGPRQDGVVRVSASRDGGAWRLAVDSQGPPIAAPDRTRIFDPFRRGSGERRADGIGLGLAICRTIVERHGGAIGVEPLDDGNRFFFTLPG